jgi:Na+-translocating ferredoxin:NAD+ oxidoreductase subunit G
LIGLKDKETIRNINVISQGETPNYYVHITESDFFSQFIDLNIDDCYSSYSWLPGGVDAASGATISSRAITNAVRDTILQKIKYIE